MSKKKIVVGLDLGTNTTVLVHEAGSKKQKAAGASSKKSEDLGATYSGAVQGRENVSLMGTSVNEVLINTVVGTPKPTILPGVLPRGKEPLFGEEAIKYKAHVELVWPVEGTVTQTEKARLFLQHVRNIVDPEGNAEVRMVLGSPANATPEDLSAIRKAVAGIIDKIVIVPEPFLAAMGFRDEDQLGKPEYHDPVVNTLFVDIGAGTTDLCKVQGYYPTREDLISMDVAGNYIDKKMRRHVERTYPDVRLADVTITRIKDENSFVGDNRKKVEIKVPVHGKHKTLDLTNAVRESCETILEPIIEKIEEMARICDPETVEEMLANVTLTGGGSQIKGLAEAVEKALKERDYLTAKVTAVEDYKTLVALGAMKTGLKLKEDQWTIPM